MPQAGFGFGHGSVSVILQHEKDQLNLCVLFHPSARSRFKGQMGLMFVGPVIQAKEPGSILAPSVPQSVFCGLQSML